MPAIFTAEDQALLLLARGSLSATARSHAAGAIGSDLDWNLVAERAASEEVLLFLYRNLREREFIGVPADVRSELEARYKINALRNTLMSEELVQVLTLLADAGIPTIPLKGMALAEALYGDTAARVCGDIDILVPRKSVRDAFRVLLAAGFEAYDEKVAPSEIDRLLDSNMEYSFVRKCDGMTFLLELHWDIAWRWGKRGLLTDDLWAEAKPKTHWGAQGYALSPEWELLYLAAHVAHHQWQGLKWLVDIHEFCLSPRIDWQKLRTKANQLGLERMLMLTLSACHQLFDTPIPAELTVKSLPQWMKIFPATANPSDVWTNNWFPTHLFGRPSEKLSYLARIAFVPTLNEQRLIALPSFLGFLYYPLRPLRLLCKWSAAALAAGVGLR